MKLIYGGFEQLLGTTAGNITLDQSSSRSSTSKGLYFDHSSIGDSKQTRKPEEKAWPRP
jgi:hypothetical protein